MNFYPRRVESKWLLGMATTQVAVTEPTIARPSAQVGRMSQEKDFWRVTAWYDVSVVGDDGIALLSDHVPKEASGEVDLDRSGIKRWTAFERASTVPPMMFASNSPYSPFFTSGLLSHAMWKDVQPEYRSFLSLDSAESRCPSTTPLVFCSSPFLHSSSFSRTCDPPTLRSIPSPKPVPLTTLPEVPDSPPRLPSLIPIPALEIPHLSSPSLTISRTPAPLTAIRRLSVATKATSSSVSARVRKSNRSEALARLEGRSKHRPITLHIKHLTPQQYNFMNMTDDEDEDDTDSDADHMFSNPVLEPEDVVLPTTFLRAPRSAPLPSQNDSLLATSSHFVRPHITLVPSTNDWLPLTSFMDLHNEDDSSSWAWSFIQVANIS
jgi:hypothetical protein